MHAASSAASSPGQGLPLQSNAVVSTPKNDQAPQLSSHPQAMPEEQRRGQEDRLARTETPEADNARLSTDLKESKRHIRRLNEANDQQHKQIRDLEKRAVERGLELSKRSSEIGDLQIKLQQARNRASEYRDANKQLKLEIEKVSKALKDETVTGQQARSHTNEYKNAHKQLELEITKVSKALIEEQAMSRLRDKEQRRLLQSLKATESNLGLEVAKSHGKDSKIDGLARDLERSARSVMQMSHEKEEIASKIRSIQEHIFSSTESAQWMPISFESIQRSLTSLTAEMKQWSRENASSQAINLEAMEALSRSKGCLLGSSRTLRAIFSQEQPKLWKQMFLQAAICSSAFMRIFSDPFFAFEGRGAEGAGLRTVDADGLRSLMSLLEPRDVAAANAWRCQLMRLLDPSPSGRANEGTSLKVITATARKSASQKLATELLHDVADMLAERARLVGEAPHLKLQGILSRCADLSWTLWTQRHRIEVLDLTALRDVSDGDFDEPLRFMTGSEYFEHHPQHNREVDSDEAVLNGREIILLVNPAIVAAGTAAGTDYERRRVWKKATVWMGPAPHGAEVNSGD